MPRTEQVYDALKSVKLTEIGKDVVAAGAVRNLVISGGAVSFELKVMLPHAPLPQRVEQLREQAVTAVKSLEGVTSAHVKASGGEAPPEGGPRSIMPGVKHVVAVASGKGGVGKSTTAANLALALVRRGHKVGLLDADIYGPSMPTMFGVNQRPAPAGDKRIHPVPAHGLVIMSIGFLVDPDTPMVWRGPMVHGALSQFLEQVEWGDLDYVIVDMPPGTGDAQLTLTQRAPLSGAVIVSTPQQVSLIDARKGLKMFEQVKVPVLGLVENMSYLIDDAAQGELDLFGRGSVAKAARELNVPFLGEVPIQKAVSAAGDAGKPIVAAEPDCAASRAFDGLAEKVEQALPVSSQIPKGLGPMAWQS